MKLMQTKFIIAGRTGSGKDYLTNYLCDTFGLKQLLSYTTRPQRFENENTHIFITDEEANVITQAQPIIAYTEIGQYKYFGTYQQFVESDIYIVDKQGIDYLKSNFMEQLNKDDIKIVVIYVYADDNIRRQRALQRNSNIDVFTKRNDVEDTQFAQLEQKMEYDWFIFNQGNHDAKRTIADIIKLYIEPNKLAEVEND
jgi:guanylate kinase